MSQVRELSCRSKYSKEHAEPGHRHLRAFAVVIFGMQLEGAPLQIAAQTRFKIVYVKQNLPEGIYTSSV